MQTAFGHLDEYSAIYYTYMWSLVIAKDLFTAFNKENLLDPVIAKKYRDAVLVPGGSLPAAQLVKNFLGRDFSFDGWKKWIEKE
jgi:thimet oligopeptidase